MVLCDSHSPRPSTAACDIRGQLGGWAVSRALGDDTRKTWIALLAICEHAACDNCRCTHRDCKDLRHVRVSLSTS